MSRLAPSEVRGEGAHASSSILLRHHRPAFATRGDGGGVCTSKSPLSPLMHRVLRLIGVGSARLLDLPHLGEHKLARTLSKSTFLDVFQGSFPSASHWGSIQSHLESETSIYKRYIKYIKNPRKSSVSAGFIYTAFIYMKAVITKS